MAEELTLLLPLVYIVYFTMVNLLANQNRKEVFIEFEVKDRDRAVGIWQVIR